MQAGEGSLVELETTMTLGARMETASAPCGGSEKQPGKTLPSR
jgi:hypothetical protein